MIGGNFGLDTNVFNAGDGNDTVNGFDAADGEKIDLAGIAGITDFSDPVANHLVHSAGNAMITHGANTILLFGVAFGDVGVGSTTTTSSSGPSRPDRSARLPVGGNPGGVKERAR